MIKLIYIVTVTLFLSGCSTNTDDPILDLDTQTELAQQIGENLASIDESGGLGNGDMAAFDSVRQIMGHEKAFVRYHSLKADHLADHLSSQLKTTFNNIRQTPLFLETAQAAACNAVQFSSCSVDKKKIKNFDNCSTVAGGAISGTVQLTFFNPLCSLPSINDTVNRVPNFIFTGSNGGTYAVSAATSGQTITRTGLGGGSFTYLNTGIKRKITLPSGGIALDVDTSTPIPLTITGSTRATRAIANSGSIYVIDNLKSINCTVTPTNVAWTSGCNCPTQGSLSGSCSDSMTFTMTFSNTCGEVNVIKGTDVKLVQLDRCQM